MNMTEAVQEGLKALVLPELKALATDFAAMRLELARQGGQLDATNYRLTDMHDTLVLLTQRQDALTQKNDELRKDLDAGLGGLRKDMEAGFGGLRQEMEARFQEQRKDMDAGLGGLRKDMEAGFGGIRQEMEARFQEQRKDMDAGLGGLRKDMEAGFGGIRQEMEARFQEQRRESDARFDRLHGRIDALIQVMVKPEEFGALRMRVERAEERIRHMRRASGQ